MYRNFKTEFITDQYEYLPIDEIEIINESIDMIDITIDSDHTFCITNSNIISHNCNNMVKGLTIPALKTQCSIIIVNHVYDDPASMFPSVIKKQGGGKGLQYMARINVQCSLAREKSKTDNSAYSATILKFMTVKNSLVKPFFKSEMYLDYSKGPNKYFGLLKPCMEAGFIEKVGHFYIVASHGEKKIRLKTLLDSDEIWDTFLPQFDEISKVNMAYAGGDSVEISDEELEESLKEEKEQNDK